MNPAFTRLSEIAPRDIMELMNHPLVRRQMPLLREHFGEAETAAFVAAKERLWSEHGYGPWAFVVDGQFAGWGGLQPEGDEVDLALVLHPNYWGMGKALYREIIRRAFGEMGFTSVTVLFPPSRTRVQGLLRLGFQQDAILQFGGEEFIRFRLVKPAEG
ncbi:MAG TPA: N-acetyltransferase [Cytophagales bacterium]|nr:N-acetyltransferase [Cytophagales bacterium]